MAYDLLFGHTGKNVARRDPSVTRRVLMVFLLGGTTDEKISSLRDHLKALQEKDPKTSSDLREIERLTEHLGRLEACLSGSHTPQNR